MAGLCPLRVLAADMKAIVLTGQRSPNAGKNSATGPLPQALKPVAGTPSLVRVVQALCAASRMEGGLLAGPAADGGEQDRLLAELTVGSGFEWMVPAEGPAESALAAAERISSWPVLLTAGDHALLTAAMIDGFCAAAAQVEADLVAGLVPFALVQARFPGMRRTRLRFADGAYCGANLYYLAGPAAASGIAFWGQMQALRKQPWRIAARLGWPVLAAYALRSLPIDKAFAAVSEAAGCTVGWTGLDDPLAAVDVDSAADLAVAEEVLQGR